MKKSKFNNMLLDIAILHNYGKLKFKRPKFYKGWVKRIIGDSVFWVDVRKTL